MLAHVAATSNSFSAPEGLVFGLLAANQRQRQEIAARDAEIARKDAEIAGLQAELKELRARSATNSRTSSKPPSSDGYAKPKRNASVPRERGRRRPGHRPGAPSAHLHQVATPDQTIVHRPTNCQMCGGSLVDVRRRGGEVRQVFDLPPVRLPVRRHHLRRVPVRGEDAGPVRPSVRALVTYLHVYQHLPFKRAAQLLQDALGISIATGSLAAMVAECGQNLEQAGFIELLIASPVIHCDETGGRVVGELRWVHVASTDRLTLLTVHAKRGVEGMDAAGVVPAYRGISVHDGWGPYAHYQDAQHALCGAHLLRELDGAADPDLWDQPWAADLAAVLRAAAHAANQARQDGQARVHPLVVKNLRRAYKQAVRDGRARPSQATLRPPSQARRPARPPRQPARAGPPLPDRPPRSLPQQPGRA